MTRKIRFLLILLPVLLSCGKTVVNKDQVEEEEEDLEGTYSALLYPVNPRLVHAVHGKIVVSKYGDEFEARVQLKNGNSGTHKQFLHTGSICPHISQDLNGDGYIDMEEAMNDAGGVTIPFDGDLSGQLPGSEFYPSGTYSYKRSTSYALLLSDLGRDDEIPNDYFVKTNRLKLGGRVVIIYSGRAGCPDSVSGIDVPIACGVLTKTSSVPTSEPDLSVESQGPRRRPPAPRPAPVPEVVVEEETPRPAHRSWWQRLRDRWRNWWNGDEEETNPQPSPEA
jgi:hypothetical protein